MSTISQVAARLSARLSAVGAGMALVAASVVLLPSAASAAPPPPPPPPWSAPRFERSIGGSGLAGVYAWGLQYNPVTDEILVGDYFNFNVRRFDRNGKQVGAFGRPATERSGQPYSLAVDPRDGSVYVPEIGDGQPRGFIAKYDKTGKFLYEFNTGARYYAWIATDDQGRLYIADSHHWNNASSPPKIRVYTLNDATKTATQVASFGTYGTGPGQMNMVRGIAVASNGDVYAADGGNNVITHFTNSGQYVRTITGPFGGDLRGITLDEANDTLWVVDADGGDLEKFVLSTGAHVRSYGSMGSGPGQFADGGRQLDVTPDGQVWVADYGNFRIQRFNSNGGFLGDYPDPATQPAVGLMSKVRDVAVGPDGSVMVADTWNHRFQRFSADGASLGAWGRRNSNPPYGMNYPRGIGVDPATGDVWVANTREHTLRVYDSAMNYRFDVGNGEDSTNTGSMRWPLDIDFAGGTAYIADYIGGRVKAVSTATGAELWSISSTDVHGVAVDAANNRIYLVGPRSNRIDAYRLDTRAYVQSFGSKGTSPGQFSSPWDIELSKGFLYVTDVIRNKVIAYSTSGTFAGEFGSTGNAPGQFRGPSGLDTDAAGQLYVADSSNFRVQVFSFGGTVTNNGTAPALTLTSPATAAVVPSGPVELTGTVADPDGVGVVEVSVRDNSTGKVWDVNSSSWATGGRWPVAAVSGPRTSGTWRYSFPASEEGRTYTVKVRAYDAVGNLSVAPFLTSSFKVSNTPPDSVAPQAQIGSPTDEQVLTSRPVALSGTASDDVALSAVQLAVKDRTTNLWWDPAAGSWGAQSWTDSDLTAPGTATSDWTWTFDDRSAPGSGSYLVQVRAVDMAGNKQSPLGSSRFSVNDAPPDTAAPTAVITAPVNQAYPRPVAASGSAGDDLGVTSVQAAVRDRVTNLWWNPATGTWGSFAWTEASLGSPGAASTTWSWTFDDSANPGSGDYFLQVRARDAAAKVSSTVGTRFQTN